MTATDVAKMVLAPGEQHGKKHYTATYAALKWLQEHVEDRAEGEALVPHRQREGSARGESASTWPSDRRGRLSANQLEADDGRRAEGLGGLDRR